MQGAIGNKDQVPLFGKMLDWRYEGREQLLGKLSVCFALAQLGAVMVGVGLDVVFGWKLIGRDGVMGHSKRIRVRFGKDVLDEQSAARKCVLESFESHGVFNVLAII